MSAAVRAAGLAAFTVLVSACEFNGVYDLPLPGGKAQGGDVYRVSAEFRNVLDLVPQSAVKVNKVTVGSVESIKLDGWTARVVLRLEDGVRLPANAVASLNQTSLLGEKYVELSEPPGEQPVGRLRNGAHLGLDRTGRNPEIEEVLGALSALLNGGGVAQLKTISAEVTKALAGREDNLRSVLARLDTTMGTLDSQKGQIVRAIDGIDKLARSLDKQRASMEQGLDTIGPGLKVLADQRRELVQLLRSLSRFGAVASRVVKASHADVIANLKALDPILTQLDRSGRHLPQALELLTTFPFPRNANGAIQGDYTNLYARLKIDLRKFGSGLQPDDGPQLPALPLPGGTLP